MKDINNNCKRALALSKRDQIVEFLKSSKEQLERIDQEGPENQEDVNMVKICVKFVIGEICLSNEEQERLEEIGE